MRRRLVAMAVAGALAGCAGAKEQGHVVRIVSDEHGFSPQTVEVAAGEPVTLVFRRTTEQTCGTEVVFEGDGSRHALPLNQDVRVTLHPEAAGELHYACGMNMLTGTIVVK